MGEIEEGPNHLVKVDNWPLFFLQRLHHFYRKKLHCDLTLLFSSLDSVKSIKVHKLVLHACTDYFETLDLKKDSEHGEFLQLSNEMHPDVVIPIISFMYTGKLEFPVTLQPRLYEAATKLRMTILTKLLDVKPNKSDKRDEQFLDESLVKGTEKQGNIETLSADDSSQELPEVTIIPNEVSQNSPTNVSRSKAIEEPYVTVIPLPNKQNVKNNVTILQQEVTCLKTSNQIKTKIVKRSMGLQIASEGAKSKVVDVSLPPTLPGRKLPIWKRIVPVSGSQVFDNSASTNMRSILKPLEKPRPTRFEWDEDLDDPTSLRPVEEAMRILSHDRNYKIIYPKEFNESGKPDEESFDDSLKRSSDGSYSESPPNKKLKNDLQDMKEYGKQQQLRNEIICSEENSDDVMDGDDLYGTCADESEEIANFNTTTPKPILKTVSKPEPPVVSKKVRFSLEGKENNQQRNEPANDFTSTKQSESSANKQKIIFPMGVSQLPAGKHHVKIVSEVLKKYPNLATRENIKLRVVSKNPAAVPPTVQQAVEGETGSGNKSSSSLVSYIFLTNKGQGDHLSLRNVKDKGFDVENVSGPWYCQVCDEANPINFESYYLYRRHLTEVHDVKVDARICEYCGLKNSKRNHLLYHLYTKHGIEPPSNISFPKCSKCNYIALSETLLLKHKSTHNSKGLTCYVCNVVFQTRASMQNHLTSGFHAVKEAEAGWKQIYRCPYCEGLFENSDKLKKHIVSGHWGKNNQAPNQGTKAKVLEPQSGQQLQCSEEDETSNDTESRANVGSSELESLNNVASGIATSLNLEENEQTIVFYEQRTAEQDIERGATIIEGGGGKHFMIASSSENITERQSEDIAESNETSSVKNEDSNSMMSNPEEVAPPSCSDHDYSEPQGEENMSEVISVHQIENQLTENSVIHQVLPDQGLVFSNQGNVVFQSPCVALPQRVLLAPGKVMLPQIAHGDQNIILSQVLPETRIILSSPMLQQPGSIIEDGNGGTIVFASPESQNQIESVQRGTMHYQIEASENMELTEVMEEDKQIEEVIVLEEESQEGEKEETTEDSLEKNVELVSVSEESTEIAEEEESGKAEKSSLPLETKKENTKTRPRAETAKIVDDWDETNESQSNVECRNDGPSRPEFF